MEPFSISPITAAGSVPPKLVSEDREVLPPVKITTDIPVNSHLPVASVLDLGSGVATPIYAEYSGDGDLNLVSIKIVDPSTGDVIREFPYTDVIEFFHAAENYAELGRRHRVFAPNVLPGGTIDT